jgi:hypothetical protein
VSDWLGETDERQDGALIPAEPAPLPATYVERVALIEACWQRLSVKQRAFLTAWRDCRFNATRAAKQLGLSGTTKPMTAWMREPDFATVVRAWRANAGVDALDKDRLLARQDDIVETLLTPKPVLHQGFPVRDPRDPLGAAILEEVEAGAAAKANETLMKAAGLLKDKELEVNIGMAGGPAMIVQVVRPDGEVIDASPVGVQVQLPEPESDESWLG